MRKYYLGVLILLCSLFLMPPAIPYAQSTLMDTCHYFPETQQQVCGLILYRFRIEGVEQDGQPGYSIAENIARFGHPITPQYTEGTMTIQQFQYAVFQYDAAQGPTAPVLVTMTGGSLPPVSDAQPINEAPPPSAETLLPPDRVGTSPNGETVLTVINDSTQELRLFLEGPDSIWITVPACPECTDYVGTIPDTCRAIAPSTRQVLPAGTYIVRTLEDPGIVPLEGTWTLEAGGMYELCLFIMY